MNPSLVPHASESCSGKFFNEFFEAHGAAEAEDLIRMFERSAATVAPIYRDKPVKGDKAPKAPRAPKSPKSPKKETKGLSPITIELRPATPETAKVFLATLRDVGRRPALETEEVVDPNTGEVTSGTRPRLDKGGNPIFVHDAIAGVADERTAIGLFIGYDASCAHGTQLDNARLLARAALRREIRQAAGIRFDQTRHAYRSPEAHQVRFSAQGFVAGLPSNAAVRLLADLAGRERVAVRDLATVEKLIYLSVGEPDPETGSLMPDVPAFRKLMLAEFQPSQQNQPILDSETHDVVGEVPVWVVNPIYAALEGVIDQPARLDSLLTTLLTIAEVRLDHIREDIDGIDAHHPSVEQVERAHAILSGRGAPIPFDEVVVAHVDFKPFLTTTPIAAV